ncbi:MAG: AraC family transcriptional regulator [Cyclobacteriaceae bacterium]|nr:AraC family transcriptional regulator [Cyclobacteriaceae bacterium]
MNTEIIKVIILLNPIYVTLFWAIVLSLYDPDKHPTKVFLGIFMWVSFILYLSHLFYFLPAYNIYRYLDAFYILAMLLVYPLYYIYVRILTIDPHFRFNLHSKYLLLPALFFILSVAGHFSLSESEVFYFFSEILQGSSKPEGKFLFMKSVYIASRLAFFLQVVVYLYLSFQLIRRHNRRIQDFYSNLEDKKLAWVQFFNVSLAVTALMSLVFVLIGRETFSAHSGWLAMPSVIFSILLFSIGLLGNRQSRLKDLENREDHEVLQNENQSIASDFNHELIEKLQHLFSASQIFKNPELKIWDLAAKLGTNRTYVSRIINQEYSRNFCNFVNLHRIQFARELMLNKPELSNEEIAEASGFGSLNSFYRAFKLELKCSVGEYRSKIKRH